MYTSFCSLRSSYTFVWSQVFSHGRLQKPFFGPSSFGSKIFFWTINENHQSDQSIFDFLSEHTLWTYTLDQVLSQAVSCFTTRFMHLHPRQGLPCIRRFFASFFIQLLLSAFVLCCQRRSIQIHVFHIFYHGLCVCSPCCRYLHYAYFSLHTLRQKIRHQDHLMVQETVTKNAVYLLSHSVDHLTAHSAEYHLENHWYWRDL